MASGLPVVASDVGALSELVDREALVPPGDVTALADAIGRRYGDQAAGEAALSRAREKLAPEPVAAALRRVYDTI
jgi:glycosyltransferase involved in cell wall biosynthesis